MKINNRFLTLFSTLTLVLICFIWFFDHSIRLKFSFRNEEKHKVFLYPQDMKKKVIVMFFLTVHCPEGKKSIYKIKSLAEQFERDVEFYFVFSDKNANPEDIRKFTKEYGVEFNWIFDLELRLAKKLKARVSSQVVALDKSNIIYTGRIDDQIQIGFELPAPRHENLKVALSQFLLNQNILNPSTEPSGCTLY